MTILYLKSASFSEDHFLLENGKEKYGPHTRGLHGPGPDPWPVPSAARPGGIVPNFLMGKKKNKRVGLGRQKNEWVIQAATKISAEMIEYELFSKSMSFMKISIKVCHEPTLV